MKKIATFSLGTFSLLGLLKIFSIIPFNRMAADDFSVAILARQSVWKAVSTTYVGGNGRFTATFLQSISVLVTGDSGKIIIYSLATFLALFFAFLLFFKKLFRVGFGNFYIFLLASTSFVALYALTPNKSESWYWLTGSATYLWPIILFLFSTSFLFENKPAKVNYLTASVLAFGSIACNETFGLIAVAAFFGLFLLSLAKKTSYLRLFMFISSLISFVIMYFAPGNTIRASGAASNPMSFGGSILYSIQEGPWHLFSLVQNNLYFIFPLIVVFAYMFSKFFSLTPRTGDGDTLWLKIFTVLTTPVLASILYMLPAFRILGRIQPDRSDSTLGFIVIASLIGTSYYLGQLVDIERFEKYFTYKAVIFLAALALFWTSFSFTKTLANDIYVAKNYSQAYDAMIIKFGEMPALEDKKDIIVSLPPSGLIAVTLDPPGHYDYKNQALSVFYGVGRVISK